MKSPAKKFGTRYGRTLRNKYAKIHTKQKSGHKGLDGTPNKLKRLAAGIWYCTKTKKKIAGRAYTPE